MRAFRQRIVVGTVLTLVGGGLSVFTAGVAQAEPCGGLGGSGSSIFGSGMGSSSLFGSLGGKDPKGPQGPLPNLGAGASQAVSWVTGPLSPNSTYDKYGISGTDLGITWDNGSGQTLMAFGDTFGNCATSGAQWRNNVLLHSDDANLADGITISDPAGYKTQIIPTIGLPLVENTVIPTAAISIGNTQFINYMSVRSWGDPGRWVTNFSAIATSTDNGATWTNHVETIRPNIDVTLPGVPGVDRNNGKFQQSAYVKGKDGWIYQYGTPNGRFGATYLARVQPADILNNSAYQYWTGATGWSTNLSAIEDTDVVVPDPVSELSVAWNDHLNKYIMMYGDEPAHTIVLRTADNPEGPWSAPKTVLDAAQTNGGVYAPFIHPKSSGKDLYFTASRWSDYNVLLIHTDLDAL